MSARTNLSIISKIIKKRKKRRGRLINSITVMTSLSAGKETLTWKSLETDDFIEEATSLILEDSYKKLNAVQVYLNLIRIFLKFPLLHKVI